MALKAYRDAEGVYQPWHLEQSIITLDPLVDLWHVHNEPDFPVYLVRKHSKKPIIYDIHDLASRRDKKYPRV